MGKPDNDEKDIASIVFTLVFVALAALASLHVVTAAWRLISHLPRIQPNFTPSIAVDSTPSTSPDPKPKETPKPQETIQAKSKRLGVRSDLLAQLLKAQSDQNAGNLLNLLESLSPEARRALGTYKRVDYEMWLLKAKYSVVSVRAIEALVDAQFVSWFPSQKGKTLNPRILGQVWYAIARHQISTLQPRVRSVQLNSTNVGTIEKGEGAIYQVRLKQNQPVNLVLTTPVKSLSLSILSQFDSKFDLLKKSLKDTWSGKAKQSGVYEIVIAPTSTDEIPYKLEIK
jgi:hypothetical protein